MQENDLVGESARLAQIVGDQDNAGAASVRARDQLLDGQGGGWVEAGGGLVEEQDLGLDRQRAHQRQALLLAA